MNVDVGLLFALGVIQLLMAWIGYRVTVNPPATPEKKTFFERVFICLGLLGLVVTICSGTRNTAVQDQLLNGVSSIQGSLSKRTIDSMAAVRIQEALRPYGPQTFYVVNYGPNDQDTSEYVDKIISVLTAADWKMANDVPGTFAPFRGEIYDIVLCGKSEQAKPKVLDPLKQVLEKEKIVFDQTFYVCPGVFLDVLPDDEAIGILVGKKKR